MQIKENKSFGVVGYNIESVNLNEMRQMAQLKERIAYIVNTHKDESVKNEYLTDDELIMLHAILYVFTKDFCLNNESAFDKALEELKNLVEKEQATPEAMF